MDAYELQMDVCIIYICFVFSPSKKDVSHIWFWLKLQVIWKCKQTGMMPV